MACLLRSTSLSYAFLLPNTIHLFAAVEKMRNVWSDWHQDVEIWRTTTKCSRKTDFVSLGLVYHVQIAPVCLWTVFTFLRCWKDKNAAEQRWEMRCLEIDHNKCCVQSWQIAPISENHGYETMMIVNQKNQANARRLTKQLNERGHTRNTFILCMSLIRTAPDCCVEVDQSEIYF